MYIDISVTTTHLVHTKESKPLSIDKGSEASVKQYL